MSTDNKNEKAGANAPATSSKVEGARIISNEIELLKSELQAKTLELDNVVAEHADFKEKLKTEFERIVGENEALKNQVESLKKGSTKGSKSEIKYVVVSAFRGTQKSEKGKVYELGDDVSEFSKERLEDLLNRGLVQKR